MVVRAAGCRGGARTWASGWFRWPGRWRRRRGSRAGGCGRPRGSGGSPGAPFSPGSRVKRHALIEQPVDGLPARGARRIPRYRDGTGRRRHRGCPRYGIEGIVLGIRAPRRCRPGRRGSSPRSELRLASTATRARSARRRARLRPATPLPMIRTSEYLIGVVCHGYRSVGGDCVTSVFDGIRYHTYLGQSFPWSRATSLWRRTANYNKHDLARRCELSSQVAVY